MVHNIVKGYNVINTKVCTTNPTFLCVSGHIITVPKASAAASNSGVASFFAFKTFKPETTKILPAFKNLPNQQLAGSNPSISYV